MDIGLNNHLKRTSAELFIKSGSLERINIERSLGSLINKLEDYFDDQVNDIIVFGSYTRDTILPRIADNTSDVDLLIQFDTEIYDKLKPESYRAKLKRFAEDIYPKAVVIKDHPSVVIELNHIKFDLVPSIFDKGIFYNSIEIPNKNGGWMETEPDKFNQKVVDANKRYKSIVKPIVRLLKYWNASHGYPYSSYELEIAIANMDFTNDNYECGFFYAIGKLSTYGFPNWAKDAVNSLKNKAELIQRHLDDRDIANAKKVLLEILPLTN